MTPEVSVGELVDEWSSGAYVLDVREPDEYAAVHVPGATLMPLGEVVARTEEIPADQPVFVVCAVGGRSYRAAEYLGSRGIDARNVAGGTDAWVRAGLPVATGNEPGERSEA